ncbi:S-layer homology domain-containing protein [Bacillus sp. JJ1609]|uniref:S-layer homology domain-containing protein n=1 Tax=Bacillus sp. JJ1609 TaxID=3122977 RepID=UPI003000C921
MMKKSHKRFFAAGVSAVIAVSASTSIPFNTFQAEAASAEFSDVNQNTYFSEAVLHLTQQGVINGFADGTFRPNQVVTRAQAAFILASALGLDTKTVNNPGFKDVQAGDWYYGSVAALVEKGIMNGVDQEYFLPGKQVTRAEMAKMLSLGYNLKAASTKTNFTDVPEKSWFSGYVSAITENAITSGISSTSFAPGQSVNRGQMAAFVYRAENQSVKEEDGEPDSEIAVPPSQDNGTSTPPGGSTPPPSQDNGGSTAPAEGLVPELAVLFGAAFTYGSTGFFFESEKVNPIYFQLSNETVSKPSAGSTLAEGLVPYTGSAEIKNVQAGQYIQIYEADSNGKIIAFQQHQITQSEIKNFNHYRFVYDKTSASNTIKINFNAKLSAETLATTQFNEVLDLLQITNEGDLQDYNKADIESIKWDTTVEDNPLLVMNFKSPITFAPSHKLQAEFLDTVHYLDDTGKDVGNFTFSPSSSEAVKVEHLVRLAFSPDSDKVAYHVSNYLSEFDANNTIQNLIYINKENYMKEIQRNANTITNYASLQTVIDEANKLPYLKMAYVYFSSNGANKLRLEFSEEVWLDQLISGTDFVINVPESDVKSRNITAYTSNTAETKSNVFYLTFDGPAIPHDGYAEVYFTPSGAAKVKDIDQNSLPSITLGGTYPGF